MLVRLLGFPALLIHGDPLVLDRWLWLNKHLPRPRSGTTLLDVGSGNGAFTIGVARAGYESLGMSWSKEDQRIAEERARVLGVANASFEVQDVRALDSRVDLAERFDVVLCFENIEHVLDDAKLMRDIGTTMRPGGLLMLTTPSVDYRPIDRTDAGPFSTVEDGSHVRKGYSIQRLVELATAGGLQVVGFDHCSGFFSQKLAGLGRLLWQVHPLVAWLAVLPFRLLPLLIDPLVRHTTSWPDYCLCMRAVKPRAASQGVGDEAPADWPHPHHR